jgi:transcriptional regulator with XRE-family HTH domain
MSEIVAILGANIRDLRKRAGWTQEKLAEKAGISVPFMTQIELARKTASLEVIENIAKALNVSYERLFKTDISENKDIAFGLHILEKDLITTLTETIHEKFDNLTV